MPHQSEPTLLVLHVLRLKGPGDVGTVAGTAGLPVSMVSTQLDELARRGLAVERDGLLPGWSLTPAGRAEHERMLAVELDAAGARGTVETGYRCFRHLNPEVLDACSRWQVREVATGRVGLNDHADRAYDDQVLTDLGVALDEIRPVGDELTGELERFGPYNPRLDEALDRARRGEVDYVTKPMIPSFHTVWFELHEDLLLTLGLDRSSEHEGAPR
jgi:DNA-binding MarR family transcriptional regulator